MEIRVYATLRNIVGDNNIHIDGAPGMTAGQVLQKIFAKHPALRPALFNEHGELRKSIHVFVNGRDIRYLNGLETLVTIKDAVRLFPPVGGGIS